MAQVLQFPDRQQRAAIHAASRQVALVTGSATGIGLALVKRMLADDSYSRVIAAARTPETSPDLLALQAENDHLELLALDLAAADSIRVATAALANTERLDLVVNTVGVLHSPSGLTPEKRLTDVDFDDMLLAFDVNALSTLRLAAALEPLLKASNKPKFVSLSARVGSIEDNRRGGWYAYRTSKAALNMLLRTLSIEWQRKMPEMTCVALHPGTVKTPLSEPFIAHPGHTVFSPSEAAEHLLTVIDDLTPEANGGFYGWDGEAIPW